MRVKARFPALLALLSRFSVRFIIFIALYMKAPMLPQLHFPFSLVDSTPFFTIHHHIPFAISPVITQTLFPIPLLLLPKPNPVIQPMPRLATLLAVALFYEAKKQQPAQDCPLRLIQRHPEKSESDPSAAQPLHPPYKSTPTHVEQMRHHQVLYPLQCNEILGRLRCIILSMELCSGL